MSELVVEHRIPHASAQTFFRGVKFEPVSNFFGTRSPLKSPENRSRANRTGRPATAPITESQPSLGGVSFDNAPPASRDIHRESPIVSSLKDIMTLFSRLSALRASSSPELAEAFIDSFEFLGAFPLGIPYPLVWTDGEVEVVFEWIGADYHAVVSFEGDGILGYTYLDGGKFVPGQISAAPAGEFPDDLRSYLRRAM